MLFWDKKSIRHLAFSIAEAMITLLIVSLALAAAAPIMSRQIKNNTTVTTVSNVPSGAVMFFRLSSCPAGWKDIPTTWDSRYIEIAHSRNISGSGLGAEGDAVAVLPPHKHFLGVGKLRNEKRPEAAYYSCYTVDDPYHPDFNCTGAPTDTIGFGGHYDRHWPRVTRANLTPNYGLSGVPVNDRGETIADTVNNLKPKHVKLLACEKI